jgi:hypothetical protein
MDQASELVAPGWPGEPAEVGGARAPPQAVADRGIGDIAEHYRQIVRGLPSEPILTAPSHFTRVMQARCRRTPGQIRGELSVRTKHSTHHPPQLSSALPSTGAPHP